MARNPARAFMSLSIGARLGPYEILSVLGRGGMGEVYRARHLKLERDVAIKVLPGEFASNRERLARFEQEARLASSLNHPNIVTIHDIAEHDGTTFIAMELVEGRTLRRIVADGPISTARAVEIAAQVADGLAKAHAAGVVHRDLKPDNVMVTADGLVKILDFGIAKALAAPVSSATEGSTLIRMTADGAVIGTPHYMSPEQFGPGPVDHRADQFAFGVVLFEMLVGKPPFDGPSLASIITAITQEPPPPLEPMRRDVPPHMAKVVRRCLAKHPDARYPSMAEVSAELKAMATGARRGFPRVSGRAIAATAGVVVLLAALGASMWLRGAERRWAEREALPQIAGLIDDGALFEAYRLARRAARSLPEDPELQKLDQRITLPFRIVTNPPGAEVSMKDYATPDAEWDVLGTTPLDTRGPYALFRLRIRKDGFETFEGAPFGAATFRTFGEGMTLEPAGTRPSGMVRVFAGMFRGGPIRLELPGGNSILPISSYLIDRYEVTNREFKAFVDAGGYRERTYWADGFPEAGGHAAWEEAIKTFRDATGRPAPSTWTLGSYPDGTADHPVSGVSWYEAAAYCRWAGKTLPTIYHWFSAVGQEQHSDILRLSNFGGKGAAAVGSYAGVSGYGAYDLAGNVREWCWNATRDGMRYALGGAWNDPVYMFRHMQARPPAERAPTNGFRCASWEEPPDAVLLDPIDPVRKVSLPPPVSDEVFDAYRGMYGYDRKELNAIVETTDDSSPHWRKEVVSFDTAYGERMQALLFLPRNAKPPYQTVLWFPGDDVFIFRSSETLASSYIFDFIPRSGRALVYPVYQGMYERFQPAERTPNARRDRMIAWSKDLGRTIDYLESRTDIDTGRLAYYGFSSGGNYGPIFLAVDPRFEASILLAAGVTPQEQRPEMDVAHFAPRCRVPTLLITGVDDFILPYDISQKPLFDLLGAPPGQKRHARLAGGHIPSNRLEIIREVLDWLDRWLGPVQTGA